MEEPQQQQQQLAYNPQQPPPSTVVIPMTQGYPAPPKQDDTGNRKWLWIGLSVACCCCLVIATIVVAVLIFLNSADSSSEKNIANDPAFGGEPTSTVDPEPVAPPVVSPVAPPPATTPVATPVAPPVAAPVTPPVDSDRCQTEQAVYQMCLNTLTPSFASVCTQCVNRALDASSLESCNVFGQAFCPALQDCSCGTCTKDIIEWAECHASCEDDEEIPCQVPIDSNTCVSIQNQAQNCMQRLPNAQACVDCANNSLNSPNFCGSLGRCSSLCDECSPVIASWVHCSNPNVGADTCSDGQAGSGPGGGAPQEPQDPNQCSAETQNYQFCLGTALSDAQATNCVDCTNAAIEAARSADEFCADFVLCGCGECADEIEDFVGCSFVQGGELRCPGSGGGSPPSNGEDVCDAAEARANSCVAGLSSPDACIQCANSASDTATSGDVWCASAASCPCGSCVDEIAQLVECASGGPTFPCADENGGGGSNSGEDECLVETDAYQSCLNTISTFDANACIVCTNAAIEGSTTVPGLCSAFGTCTTCGVCTSDMETWLGCALVDTSPFSC